MLTLSTGFFASLMLNEHRAAQNASRQSQARAFAESGAEVARQFLDRTDDDQQSAGGLYDNPQRFYNQIVADDDTPRDQGRFTVLAPKIDDTAIEGARYGLQDESARINLATILNYDKSSGSASSDGDDAADNTNAHAMLMGLPGMTDAAADCHSRLDRRRRHDTRERRKRAISTPASTTAIPPAMPRPLPSKSSCW